MEIKDIKCCGNCKNNIYIEIEKRVREESCGLFNDPDGSHNVCRSWEYDNLTAEEREIAK